jgi:general secretion pathway protein C
VKSEGFCALRGWFGLNHNRRMSSATNTNRAGLWGPRLAAFLLAALAAASAVYWGLKWPGNDATGSKGAAAAVATSEGPVADPSALARALGGGNGPVSALATADTSATPGRMVLMGVVANPTSPKNGGAALISIDGKPAKPYRVGTRVDDNTVLQSVGPRSAVLAATLDGPASQTLELPVFKR